MTSIAEKGWAKAMFGDKLLSKGGKKDGAKEEVDTAAALGDAKYVGIYFSASWCGPCHRFTPMLATFYEKMKGKLEVVFASSDRDEDAFKKYYEDMPWCAVDFKHRDVKGKLSSKFKVRGIPTLVIVDAVTGETVTEKGRGEVMSDPEGANFPWKPKTYAELMADAPKLLRGKKDGESSYEELDMATHLKGKKVAYYFSAHWCGPCRAFTPQLAKMYNKMKEEGRLEDFEIVFVSSDQSQEGFDEYFGSHPWVSLPLDHAMCKSLSDLYDCQGIPQLTVVDGETGEVIRQNARGAVSSDPEGKECPWYRKPLYDIDDDAEGINETTSVILMFDQVKAEDKDARKKMTEVAAKVATEFAEDKSNVGDKKVIFFTAGGGELCGRLRSLFSKVDKTEGKAQLLIANLKDNGAYHLGAVLDPADVSEDAIKSMIEFFKAGNLERLQAGQ